MKIKDIKIGDILVIRDWEDMEQEFGISVGNIPCYCTFTEEMRKFCGKTCTVDHIYDEDGNIGIIKPRESSFRGYTISSEMVKSIYESEIDDISELDIENILMQGGTL